MRNIAVTGSFATGKTHIINCIINLGYKTFSCDDYVKLLYQDRSIKFQIEQEIKGLQQFDKAKLAKIIYNDALMKQKLENIIHPLVRKGIREFESDNKNENLVFTEVPLLFETGFDKYFSKFAKYLSICQLFLDNLLTNLLNSNRKHIFKFARYFLVC